MDPLADPTKDFLDHGFKGSVNASLKTGKSDEVFSDKQSHPIIEERKFRATRVRARPNISKLQTLERKARY
jgi:hypothetical protein